MNAKKLLAVLVAASLLISCDYQKFNHYEQPDLRAGNDWVYGKGLDSAPKQLAVKYPINPDLDLKANEVRHILFGNDSLNIK